MKLDQHAGGYFGLYSGGGRLLTGLLSYQKALILVVVGCLLDEDESEQM